MAPKHNPSTATKAVGKCKAEKISFTEANERIRAAGGHAWDNVKDPVGVIREMRGGAKVKKKPKTATAGEKIVMRWGYTLEMCRNDEYYKMRAADVDRAIARAVKRERLRCMAIIANARDATPYTAVPKVTISRVLCSIEEGEQP